MSTTVHKVKDFVAKHRHTKDSGEMATPAIPATMKAAQLVAYKKALEVNEIPVPEIRDSDVLIKIGAAGWCHTDYQVWEGVYGSPFPMTPSHEPVGTVVKIGPKAEGKFKIGDRVGALLFQQQCHKCINCVDNGFDIRFCKDRELKGLKNNGGMAEYMVSDAEQTFPLPEGLPFEQAAPLMCAGATVWRGIENTGLKGSEAIGVVGIGGLGSLCVQFAKALGYKVVAIDNRIEGRDLAVEPELKADYIVDFNDKDAAEQVRNYAGKGGLASIICCTDVQEAITWCLSVLRTKGTLVEIGLPVEHIKFDSFDLIFEEKKIVGSLVCTKPEIIEMLKIVDKYNVRSHVTTVTLDQIPELPTRYMDPHLKGRLVMKIES